MNSLNDCIQTLKMLVDFDAALILTNCTEDGHHLQLWSEGYDSACTQALSHDFPALYPPGFTACVSPAQLLPPSISQQGDDLYPPFRSTDIYKLALHRQGFRDGMTLELWHQDRPIGLAHFSSKTECAYGIESRKLARVARQVIETALERATLVLHTPESFTLRIANNHCTGASRLLAPHACDRLTQTLSHLPRGTQPIRFYWPDGRHCYSVTAVSLASNGVLAHFTPVLYPQQITGKELHTLSWLIAGLADQEIARALHVSERTVHSHVSSLLRKLDVSRRSQAAVKAAINHWYIPDPDGILFASLHGSCMTPRPEPRHAGRLRP
ncbi:LuxR C-terminal-related transcriptional regulator [Pseudomonas sp. NPDC089401]|uniref:LuxR C-terminal-related transcriptional regulator n=1 Tax=Pseudomonas sp. NPDC089401 TaxID=3364462 RepID=UPI00382E1C36